MAKLRYLSGLILVVASLCAGAAQPPRIDPMAPIQPHDSVLVVAPHPDDESLCCGGLIELARRAGAKVAIVWVTVGDGSRIDAMLSGRTFRPGPARYRSLAAHRSVEARTAADILGVPHDRQFLLAYPDRGILPLTVSFHAAPWRSRRTGEQAVYLADAYSPGAAYEGQNLERDLASIVDEVNPTLVLAPSPRDAHPDHRGSGIMAMRVMAERGEIDKIRYWIVHGGRAWPSPRALRPELAQTLPPRAGRDMQWESLSLDAQAREAKQRAIEAHWSQMRVMGRIMHSYVRATELYARSPGSKGESHCIAQGTCATADLAPDEFAHAEGGPSAAP